MAKKINVFSIIAGCCFGVLAILSLYQYFRYGFDFQNLIIFVSYGLIVSALFVGESLLFIIGASIYSARSIFYGVKYLIRLCEYFTFYNFFDILIELLLISSWIFFVLIPILKKRAILWGILTGSLYFLGSICNYGITINSYLSYYGLDNLIRFLPKLVIQPLIFIILFTIGCIFAGLAIKKQWKNSIVEGEQ